MTSRVSFDQEGFLLLVDEDKQHYLSLYRNKKNTSPLPDELDEGKSRMSNDSEWTFLFRESDFFVDFCSKCHERILIRRTEEKRYKYVTKKSSFKCCEKCSVFFKEELRNEIRKKDEEFRDLLEYLANLEGKDGEDYIKAQLTVPELSLKGFRLPRFKKKKQKKESETVRKLEELKIDENSNIVSKMSSRNVNTFSETPKFDEEEISLELLEEEESTSNVKSHLLNEHFPSFLSLIDRYYEFVCKSVNRYPSQTFSSSTPFSCEFERSMDYPKKVHLEHVTTQLRIKRKLLELDSVNVLNETFRIWPFSHYCAVNDLVFVTSELFPKKKGKKNDTKRERFLVSVGKDDGHQHFSHHHSLFLWKREDGSCINIPPKPYYNNEIGNNHQVIVHSHFESMKRLNVTKTTELQQKPPPRNKKRRLSLLFNIYGDDSGGTLDGFSSRKSSSTMSDRNSSSSSSNKLRFKGTTCYDFSNVIVNHMIREKEKKNIQSRRIKKSSSSSDLDSRGKRRNRSTTNFKQLKQQLQQQQLLQGSTMWDVPLITKQDYEYLVRREERRMLCDEEVFSNDVFNIPNAAHGFVFLCVLRILQKYLKIIGPEEKSFFLRFQTRKRRRRRKKRDDTKTINEEHQQQQPKKKRLRRGVTRTVRISNKEQRISMLLLSEEEEKEEEVMEVEMVLNGSYCFFNLPNSKKRLNFFLTNSHTNSKTNRKNYESSIRVLCFILMGIWNGMMTDRARNRNGVGQEFGENEDENNNIVFPYPMWMNEKNEILIQCHGSPTPTTLKIEFFGVNEGGVMKKSLRILKLILTNLKYCIIQL